MRVLPVLTVAVLVGGGGIAVTSVPATAAPAVTAPRHLLAPKPARRTPVLHPAPAPASTAPVVVRAVDLADGGTVRGFTPEFDTTVRIEGGSTSSTQEWVAGASAETQDLYRTQRWGDFTATVPGLLPRTTYTVRLLLAETYWQDTGRRVFDVMSGDVTARSGIDVAALAGGVNRATSVDVRATTDATGTLDLGFRGVVDRPSVAGIQVLWDQPVRRRVLFPADRDTRVMALGDSITVGSGAEGQGGYRMPLWRSLAGDGRRFTPVGPVNAPPTSGDYASAGFAAWGGWRIDDLLGRGDLNTTGTDVDDWLRDAAPDVVLVHIGNNDSDAGEPTSRIRAELGELLDRITADRPDAEVVVARVINVRGTTQARLSAYNEAVADVVAQRSAAGRRVDLVDMEPVVSQAGEYFDDVHPSAQGYDRMAQAWYDALSQITR